MEDECIFFFITFSSNKFVRVPPIIPEISETIGRKIANGRPSIEYVIIIESIPVWGVEIRNETVAPFDAPSLLKATPVGITPQEQSGSGMPNKLAYKTDLKSCLPKNLLIVFFEIIT